MNKEIVTDPLEAENLWNELKAVINDLNLMNCKRVYLLFGFSWGRDIYEALGGA